MGADRNCGRLGDLQLAGGQGRWGTVNSCHGPVVENHCAGEY